MDDLYDILGVNEDASKDEIKKAYKKKANEIHPDKKNGNEEDFKVLQKAYEILSDENKKRKYFKGESTVNITPEEEAFGMVMNIMGNVIFSNSIEDLRQQNIVDHVKQIILKEEIEKEKFIAEQEAIIPKLEKLKPLMKVDYKHGFAGAIDNKIGTIKQNLETQKHMLELLPLMLEIIDKFQYMPEATPEDLMDAFRKSREQSTMLF